MKQYVLTDADFEQLLSDLARDPRHPPRGGSQVLTEVERTAYDEAHRFYHYAVSLWIEKAKR